MRVETLRIDGSLYSSAASAGIPVPVVLQAYRALGNRVDFQRDVRRGDRVTIAYEHFRHAQGNDDHPGTLVAATLSQGTRGDLSIYRFSFRGRFSGFFDASGASVETTLIRTPVRQGRLTSTFGRRDHPILGYTRMHEGLDFAASRGTPVVAAGDGRIVRLGRSGGYGRYIRLRHDSSISTSYGHLSDYADGLVTGARVAQGQIIGYVGATGLATGPNLHYEVSRNGKPVDPGELDLPPNRTLKDRALESFQAMRRRVDRLVNARLQERRDGDGALLATAAGDE
jgi:murein DD-endopeptidase MepM/ murein hydrolase activator NlpD